MRTKLLLATALLVAGVSVAQASAPPAPILLQAEPTDGAHLKKSPTTVTLSFNEPLDAHYSRIEVFNSCGKRIDDGTTTLDVTTTKMSAAISKRFAGHHKIFYVANAIPKGATGETSGYLHFDAHKGRRC